mgnify:CR=1 FL=1
MSYRDRLKKTITLPSGYKVQIEKLNALNAPFMEKRASETEGESGRRLSVFILTNKVGPLDGLKIVETVTSPTTEIGIGELEQADADFIIGEVLDFSGLSKRAEEARRTFPEAGTEGGGERAPSGATVSGAPAH